MTNMKKDDVLRDLKGAGDPEQAKIIAGYLKTSSLEFLGVKIPEIAKIVGKHLKGLSDDDMMALMEALWSEQIFESRRAAVDVMKKYSMKGNVDSALRIIDGWIDQMDTWALMDPIGSNCLGTLLLRKPDLEKVFIKWSKSDNFWRRRASILPYLFLSLKQNYKPEYAERILSAVKPHIADEEFFVGKAAGWVIRELSKREPKKATKFISEHKGSMTKLVLKESSKKV
ncbi:MAG: DNA alkylation repair protein [Candidatus Thorarchaeota archaeon]